MSRSAENVAAQRERVLNRTTVSPVLPDVICCAVVGLTYVDDYPKNVRRLERLLAERSWMADAENEPVPVVLVRNPANTYDANAVEVHCPATGMLGHLPAAVAARIGPDLDAGHRWDGALDGVRTSPQHIDNPGVDVRLTRRAPEPEDPVLAVVREWAESLTGAEIGWYLSKHLLQRSGDDAADRRRVGKAEIARRERNRR